MDDDFSGSVANNRSPCNFVSRGVVTLSIGFLSTIASIAEAEPSKQRLKWESLSPEQQSALKSTGIQLKEVSLPRQKYYVYQEGRRTVIEIKGEGALAVFRMEGSGTDLRYAGRGEIKIASPKSAAELKAILEQRGVQLENSMDAVGQVWTVRTDPGLIGLKALNSLQESGLATHASPDWQRDLRKK
jgi:hypothetical protein